jgi:plastocyanin
MRPLGVPLIVAVTWLQLWPMQAAPAATTNVSLTDNAYTPPSVTVQVNDTVTWRVPPSVVGSCHSVSSDDGLFDSGTLAAGLLCLGGGAQSWSHTFTRAGTFRYHCKVVSGMAGVVTVAAPPNPTPPPTPPPSPSQSPTPTPSPSVSPTPSPSGSASPSASPSGSATPTATVGQVVVPTSTTSGLAAGTGGGGGSSTATVVAIIAGLIALACAGALIALRRLGAW